MSALRNEDIYELLKQSPPQRKENGSLWSRYIEFNRERQLRILSAHGVTGLRAEVALHDAQSALFEAVAQRRFRIRSVETLAEDFRRYADQIVRNKAADAATVSGKATASLDESVVRDVQSDLNVLMDRLVVGEGMNRLSPRSRNMLRLKYSLGLSDRRMAEVLGISASTANGWMKSAQEELRRLIGSDGSE